MEHLMEAIKLNNQTSSLFKNSKRNNSKKSEKMRTVYFVPNEERLEDVCLDHIVFLVEQGRDLIFLFQILSNNAFSISIYIIS